MPYLKDFHDATKLYIPHTGDRYEVSLQGEIKDIVTNKVLEPIADPDGEKLFSIEDEQGNQHILKLSVIMALTFKRNLIPSCQWVKLDVMYIDADQTNSHPGNLVWKYPVEGIAYSLMEGFRYIPGFSRYVINAQGLIFDQESGKLILPSYTEGGYPTVRLLPDTGKIKSNCLMHRVLAIAFYPYPSYVDKLDVNHKDGVKINYNLVNLEWATRKENCDHAYATGLRDDNVPIQIKDIFTGDVFEFYSDADCNQHFGLKLGASRFRSKTKGQKVYDYGVLIREKGCGQDWKEITDPVEAVIKDTKRFPIEVTSVETGETKIYPNVFNAANALGMQHSSVRYFVKKLKGLTPINGYYLKVADIESLNRSFFDVIRRKKSPLTAGNPC